ncbi:MAG TPA: DUF3857 domain-containing protein [Pyrinomonadaceae bacterium]|nr:DUF3857 domain-containing protein [Pyrinomonadaceae bacterium]
MKPQPKFPRARLRLAALCLLALMPATALAFGDKDWQPVDPAHLAMKEPVVERDADAEVIFWEVRVSDEVSGYSIRAVLDHYVRIKIFTERGRESQSRIDILAPRVFGREIRIKDIAARTITPGGQIVELKKEDIFERDVVRLSGVKVKAKTFSMPAVEPGAIIEYRWREERGDTLSNYVRLDFARDIPVQRVKYSIKPLSFPGFTYGMRARTFQAQMPPMEKEKNGFYAFTLTNVPAFREEPRMPPEYSVRPWMLIYYTEDRKLDADKFWKEYGRLTFEANKSNLKVNDEVKAKAAEIVGDAADPEQKLARLFEFCRTKIKNVYDDASGMTPQEREKVKANKTPSDTLKRGVGTGRDIDMLFAALATAAGFEARVANLADREDVFFDPGFADDVFVRTYNIAVRVGDQWRFFDPASNYVPFGMLRWQEEGVAALLSDPKEPVFVNTPVSGPEKSLEKRTARLSLDAEGTLAGEVRIEYTGHLAAARKELNDDDTPEEREAALRELFKSRLGGVEISDVKIENVAADDKPFAYTFRVRVPGYAQRTGKRLFVQPAFFQRGLDPLFPTGSRRHDVYFHYPWSEEDKVEITLPEGYALDNPESPSPFAAGPVSRYEPKAAVTKDGRTLIYTRSFFFNPRNEGGLILFPASSYPQLKQYFDQVHKQDGHTISLKQAAAAAASSN